MEKDKKEKNSNSSHGSDSGSSDDDDDELSNDEKELKPYRPELETVICQKLCLLVPSSGPKHPRTVYFSKDILIPINYFMQYYRTNSMYDRIIKLAIVLESSVLAGIKGELNYRLKIRASAFLKRDCKKILDMFYKLRSSIVHNGTIDIKCFDDIRKIINDEQCSNSKALFVFVSDYIEHLVRDILYKSFEIFAEDETIKNYNQLFLSVDNEILEKITK